VALHGIIVTVELVLKETAKKCHRDKSIFTIKMSVRLKNTKTILCFRRLAKRV